MVNAFPRQRRFSKSAHKEKQFVTVEGHSKLAIMRLLRVNLDLVFAASFQVLFVWNYFVSSTEATCNEEQVHSCKKSAAKGELDKLGGGGQCQPKPYVQFTHLCTVSHYLPSVDYCCCEYEQRVLCCRYHQDWDTFRCSQGEDTVDTVHHGNDGSPNSHSSKTNLPLEILLPAIIGPIVLFLCCVFCCVKCCCYRYDDDTEILCCNSCDEKREKPSKEKPPVAHTRGKEDDASVPLTYGLAPSQPPANQVVGGQDSKPCPRCRHLYSDSGINALPYAPGGHQVEPSAPPIEDPYSSTAYASVCLQQDRGVGPTGVPVSGERNSAYARSQSESSGSTGSHCSGCGRASSQAGPVYRSLSAGAAPSTTVPIATGSTGSTDRPMCPSCSCNSAGGCGGAAVGTCSPPSYDESQRLNVLPPHLQAELYTQPHIHPEPASAQEKC